MLNLIKKPKNFDHGESTSILDEANGSYQISVQPIMEHSYSKIMPNFLIEISSKTDLIKIFNLNYDADHKEFISCLSQYCIREEFDKSYNLYNTIAESQYSKVHIASCVDYEEDDEQMLVTAKFMSLKQIQELEMQNKVRQEINSLIKMKCNGAPRFIGFYLHDNWAIIVYEHLMGFSLNTL